MEGRGGGVGRGYGGVQGGGGAGLEELGYRRVEGGVGLEGRRYGGVEGRARKAEGGCTRGGKDESTTGAERRCREPW